MLRLLAPFLILYSVATAHDVIGYLPSYRVNAQTIKSLDHCTDVTYFGSTIGPDGSIVPAKEAATHLAEIRKAIAGQPPGKKCRLILCLGGWKNDRHFPAVTASPDARKHFAISLSKAVDQYRLDGIDLDWEYPKDDIQWQNLGTLIQAGKSAVPHRPLLWSAAVNPNHLIPLEVVSLLDRIHLMTYDSGSRHCAPSVAEKAIKQWTEHGVDPEKLCIGAAFYGRKMDRPGDVKTYAEIVRMYGGQARKTATAGGYFYDDPSAIRRKKQLVIQSKLRGIIIWEIGQDAPGADALLPLLK